MLPLMVSRQWPLKEKPKVDRNKISYLKDSQACSVPNCRSNRHAKGVRYPRDEKLCNQWIDAIGIDLTFAEVKVLKLKVCHGHFRADQFYTINNGRAHKVKYDVVPSLNLPDRKENPTQNTSDKENMEPLAFDETYRYKRS